MKTTLSLFLVLLLSSCSYHPSANTAGAIGDKIKACCSSISMAKEAGKLAPASCTEKTETESAFSASILERTGQILTW